MVPQKRYKPLTSESVDEVQLEPSINFHMSNPDELGIPLRDALRDQFSRLEGRDHFMFELKDYGPFISLYIHVSLTNTSSLITYQRCLYLIPVLNQWPGYNLWTYRISTTDSRVPPRPTTLSKLAKHVARSFAHYIAVSAIFNQRDNCLLVRFRDIKAIQWKKMETLSGPWAPVRLRSTTWCL